MALVNLKTVLDHASRNRYAVGAFNVINLDFLEAIVKAAEGRRSPVILNIAEVHFPYVTLEHICPAIKAMAEKSNVPLVLNLDHGESFAAIIRAVRNGFTSVMIDGSKLSYEDNVRQTADVVKICHAVGVSVEAELGAVGGEEGGGLVGTANPDMYTNVEQARDFVQRTGIDALAVAIGNAHGKYKGKPQLDFTRLEQIRDQAGIPLVLHGGSGIPDEDFRKAIGLGIAKINFFTGMSLAAIEATGAALQQMGQAYNDYPNLIKQVTKSVQAVVEQQIDVFGSGHVCEQHNSNCLGCGSCGKPKKAGAAAPAPVRSADSIEQLIQTISKEVIAALKR
jgi:fructose-bisphosphate aldolase, class II